jgi:hypothetical protein
VLEIAKFFCPLCKPQCLAVKNISAENGSRFSPKTQAGPNFVWAAKKILRCVFFFLPLPNAVSLPFGVFYNVGGEKGKTRSA